MIKLGDMFAVQEWKGVGRSSFYYSTPWDKYVPLYVGETWMVWHFPKHWVAKLGFISAHLRGGGKCCGSLGLCELWFWVEWRIFSGKKAIDEVWNLVKARWSCGLWSRKESATSNMITFCEIRELACLGVERPRTTNYGTLLTGSLKFKCG